MTDLARRRQQVGAGKGTRSKKSGQSIFFEGYKKHTLYALLPWADSWRPLPLYSLLHAGNLSEQRVLKPLLNYARRTLGWPMLFVVVDQGYVNTATASFLRRRWQLALVARPKKNMVPPPGTDTQGCPLCPAGEALVWEDYDGADGQLIYRGHPPRCARCPLAGTCPRQFELEAGLNEIFWGMVPSHSRLFRLFQRWCRPRVEPGFNLVKHKYRVKDFFINSRDLGRFLCILSDILEILELLAAERPAKGRQTRRALEMEVQQPELWDKF